MQFKRKNFLISQKHCLLRLYIGNGKLNTIVIFGIVQFPPILKDQLPVFYWESSVNFNDIFKKSNGLGLINGQVFIVLKLSYRIFFIWTTPRGIFGANFIFKDKPSNGMKKTALDFGARRCYHELRI